MKKLLVLIMGMMLLSGCLIYGKGQTNGYITTIEEGIFWDIIWIRAELESSNTDAYLINKSNHELKEKLQITSDNKTRVKLMFKKHAFTLSNNTTNSEVIDYKILN